MLLGLIKQQQKGIVREEQIKEKRYEKKIMERNFNSV